MKKGSFLKGIAVGSMIGGAMGVLFAPKSGKETREQIKKEYDRISNELKNKMSEMKDMTQQKYVEFRDKTVEEFKKRKDVTQDQVNELKTRLNKEWEERKGGMNQAAHDVKKNTPDVEVHAEFKKK